MFTVNCLHLRSEIRVEISVVTVTGKNVWGGRKRLNYPLIPEGMNLEQVIQLSMDKLRELWYEQDEILHFHIHHKLSQGRQFQHRQDWDDQDQKIVQQDKNTAILYSWQVVASKS